DMLLADPARRDHAPRRQCDGWAEDGLRHKDSFGMMPEGAMPEVSGDLLAGIEPAMDRQIILDRPAPLADGRQRMVIGMRHRCLLRTHAGCIRRSRSSHCS